MTKYRPRVMCRLDATLDATVSMWREHPGTRMPSITGKPMAMDVQVRSLMRYTLRRLIAGDIGAEYIRREGKLNSGTVSRYRVNIPHNMYLLMDGVLTANSLTPSLLMRASIRMYPELEHRLKMEREYASKQGLGDPEWMSDDFLHLWNKYNSQGPVEDGVHIVRAIRDLELKFQTVVDKVSKLDLLFRSYGVEGILASEEVPLRKAIEAMDINALRAVSNRWSIRTLDTDTEEKVRSRILIHFGYSRGK